jgi:lysophospholipase L1-like esterase
MVHETVSKDHTGTSEKLCVIFGTSITEHVDGGMLSKKDRTVVNVSSPGANIDDIRMMANDFHQENLRSIHKIEQIVVSVGTNDIKWYNSYDRNLRRDMKPKLILLIQELKQLYTSAQIYFHTVLPMRVVYKYTAASVHQFNNLLYEVCCQFRCFFFDCFARFLDQQGIFYNRTLFRDNWHLSNAGLRVLCRALKFMIHGKLFNPLPRYTCYPRSYPF